MHETTTFTRLVLNYKSTSFVPVITNANCSGAESSLADVVVVEQGKMIGGRQIKQKKAHSWTLENEEQEISVKAAAHTTVAPLHDYITEIVGDCESEDPDHERLMTLNILFLVISRMKMIMKLM